jgi:hypothetical protein
MSWLPNYEEEILGPLVVTMRRNNVSRINQDHENMVNLEKALRSGNYEDVDRDGPVEFQEDYSFNEDLDIRMSSKAARRRNNKDLAHENRVSKARGKEQFEANQIAHGIETTTQYLARKANQRLNRPPDQVNNKNFGKPFKEEIKWTFRDVPSRNFGTLFTITFKNKNGEMHTFYGTPYPLDIVKTQCRDFPQLVRIASGRRSTRPEVNTSYYIVDFKFKSLQYYIVLSQLNGNNGAYTNTDDHPALGAFTEVVPPDGAYIVSNYLLLHTIDYPVDTLFKIFYGDLCYFDGQFSYCIVVCTDIEHTHRQRLDVLDFLQRNYPFINDIMIYYGTRFLNGNPVSLGTYTFLSLQGLYEYVIPLYRVTFSLSDIVCNRRNVVTP